MEAGECESSADSSSLPRSAALDAPKVPMSGPNSLLRSFIVALLALVTSSASPEGRARASSRHDLAGPPRTLRTEQIFDRETLRALGIPHPSRLAYDAAGFLYVLDGQSRRVVKLDSRGVPLHDVGGYGQDEASFSIPSDLLVDRRQSILVLDRGKNALLAFDEAGRFLGSRSVGMDVAAEAFTPAARLLLDSFGALWLLASRERDLVPLNDRLERVRRSRFLAPEESLLAPVSASFSPNGDVSVYDSAGGILRRYGPSGKLLHSSRLPGSADVAGSVELAADQLDYLYVADPSEMQVLAYDASGVLCLARTLGGPGSPWRPSALAVSRFDRIAIADPDRGEIQILVIERERAP